MKIKMRQDAVGPDRKLVAGQIEEVADELATRLIQAGIATPESSDGKVERSVASFETADLRKRAEGDK